MDVNGDSLSEDTYPWRYVDRSRVSIRIGDAPVDDHVNEVWEFDWPGAIPPREWLVPMVESIATSSEPYPIPYAVDVNDRRTEWGASAAFFEVVLYLAASGIVGNAAWDAIKLLGGAVMRKVQEGRPEQATRAVDEREAVERSQWLVAERFKEPADSLELISAQVEPPNDAEIVFVGPSGWRYTCTLAVEESLVRLIRIRRER